MPGLGYKAFTTGEVLTAANLQGYAVDQSVMKFASSAARTSALPSPSQGMVSFLNDSGTTWIYYAAYNASTNPGGAASAGWYPLPSIASFLGTFSGSAGTGANVFAGQTSFLFTEYFDGLAWHSTVTNTDRITPTVAGFYKITAAGQYGANANGSRIIVVNKNGTAVARFNNGGTQSANAQISTIMLLNGSTDYVTVLYNQDSGSTLSLAGQVGVEFIRPTSV
jgi:hypothetical protein